MARARVAVPMRVDLRADIGQANRVQPVQHRRRPLWVPPVGGERAEMGGFVRVYRGRGHARGVSPPFPRRPKIYSRRTNPLLSFPPLLSYPPHSPSLFLSFLPSPFLSFLSSFPLFFFSPFFFFFFFFF